MAKNTTVTLLSDWVKANPHVALLDNWRTIGEFTSALGVKLIIQQNFGKAGGFRLCQEQRGDNEPKVIARSRVESKIWSALRYNARIIDKTERSADADETGPITQWQKAPSKSSSSTRSTHTTVAKG